MAVAAVFILGQADFKRMLAYSSVEHMGILALGVGLGGAGTFGALLHAVNHSLTKAMLFLVAGNILAAYRDQVRPPTSAGVLRVLPVSGVLWVAGSWRSPARRRSARSSASSRFSRRRSTRAAASSPWRTWRCWR